MSLREQTKMPTPPYFLRLRQLPIFALFTFAYTGLFFFSVLAAFYISHLFANTSENRAFTFCFCLGLCMAAGFWLNFATGPIQLRLKLNADRLKSDDWLRLPTTISEIGLWKVSDTYSEMYFGQNVLVTGFSFGKGWFRPAVFISERVLKDCPESELAAIIHHELAHLLAQHAVKRWLLSCMIYFSITSSLVAIALFYPHTLRTPWVMAGIFVELYLFSLKIKQFCNRQEIEADKIAVERFGASPACLISAINRLNQINKQETNPLTKTRIKNLEILINDRQSRSINPAA